jgi:O-antigen/teichoic acid export membrane protein
MLGQSEYGLYSLVASVVAYLTIFDLGFGNAVIRYTAKFRAEKKITEQYEMFGMFFILYLVIGIIAFVAGLSLYFNVDNLFGATMSAKELHDARIMMLLLIFNLAFTFPMSIFGSIINAYENFVFQKSINIARVLLNTAVIICLLHMGYKAVAMVIAQTVFNVLTLFINYFYCKYRLRIKILFAKFNWSFLREVAIYSFWIFLNVIMDKIYWSTGQFILGAVVGTAAVAVFAIAIHLQTMYMNFSTAISGVFLPKVTAMVAKNTDENTISELFVITGRIQYIVMAFVLSGFIVFGKAFINLWVGESYSDAYWIALIFFIPLTVPLIQNLGITILQAKNQMKFRSLLYVAIAIISLILQIVFAKMWGGIGCAIAIAAGLILGQILVMNIYYHRKQNLNMVLFWREIIKMSIIPILLILVSIFALHFISIDSWGKLMLYIGIFSVVYIPLFFYLSMNKYERNLFISPINKMLHLLN